MERLDLPVQVDLRAARLAAEIEASAYFIVAEALTNVMKHSRASHAEVRASVEDDVLQVDVRDDGVGGADATGHGLVGMADRVTALGGQLTIDSPADRGTHVRARFPLSASTTLAYRGDFRLALPFSLELLGTIARVPTSVLVIDDDATFRALAVRMLEGMGLSVVGEAATVEAATVAATEAPTAGRAGGCRAA